MPFGENLTLIWREYLNKLLGVRFKTPSWMFNFKSW